MSSFNVVVSKIEQLKSKTIAAATRKSWKPVGLFTTNLHCEAKTGNNTHKKTETLKTGINFYPSVAHFFAENPT